MFLDGSHEEAQIGVVHVGIGGEVGLDLQHVVAVQLLAHGELASGGLLLKVVDDLIEVAVGALGQLYAVDEGGRHARHVVVVDLGLLGLAVVVVELIVGVGIAGMVLDGYAVA